MEFEFPVGEFENADFADISEAQVTNGQIREINLK